MFWGVPPPPRGDAPVTTVRNLTSPFWIGTLRHSELRCLVPATSYPLWSGAAGRRRQLWLSVADRPLFAFAGIVRFADEIPHFALLATDPNPLVARLAAGAMPLILHAGDGERWLAADWKDAQTLVAPFPAHLMTATERNAAPPPSSSRA